MIKILASRLFTGLFVVLTVISITFFLLRSLPGGPFDTEKKLPAQIQKNIEKKYNLDQPLWKQYSIYLYSICRGDFGPSYKYVDRSVNDIIKQTFPVSLKLGFVSLLLSLFLGCVVGIFSSIKRGRSFDFLSFSFSTALISVPSFVIGAFLIYIFSVKYGLLPAALWGEPKHYILPGLTLAAGPAAYLMRLVRSSMLDVTGAQFIRTAKAKGLKTYKIIFKHIFKNALIPIVTVLGPITAYLVTGSFVVEHIYAIPGMGKFFVLAVSNRDYPLIMGITVIYTVVLVVSNLIVDMLYIKLDPRIRFGISTDK
ncbi:MAG: ABC transporter permease subunit [Nitrosopumilaceae archaeon]|nr:ABC transporter permease subunit [Nitrosopumilaceae archaeon]